MVPFQFDMRRSSPSARPYEHASETLLDCIHCKQARHYRTSSEALLAFLKLLEEPEVSRDLGAHYVW